MTRIALIVGSTRHNRFSEKVAKWFVRHMEKRPSFETRVLDLRDFPMPFFDQAVPPSAPGRARYPDPTVQRWTAEIAQADGFIFITPEYNYGTSGVLKNAIDWVYPEWNRKTAAFISYGSAGGARVIQQLRLTAIELQLAPIRFSLHIPTDTLMEHFRGADVEPALAKSDEAANRMLDDLVWWTEAIKAARGTPARAAAPVRTTG